MSTRPWSGGGAHDSRRPPPRPDHAVLGEEYGASGVGEWCWYLDPIDGTSHFVNGDPDWMTFVALGRGTEVAIGVIVMPARSRRWWASRGEGAFADGQPMVVSATGRLADAVVNDDWTGTLAGEPASAALAEWAALVRPSEGEGFVAVAAGLADVAVGGGGHAWDYAAAKILVEEAGGRLTDLAGGDRFDAGAAVVTNGRIHDEVLAVVRSAASAAS
jgi:histidinol-phosphatase